jgi:hypothetical protein
MAVALIAAFVLAAVGMFLIGARLVKHTPAPDLSSVSVVAFAGQSPGAPFTTGLAEALARNGGLSVVDGSGAGVLLGGSVEQSGDRMRVTARLIQAAGRNVLWAHTFDLAIQDVPAVQQDIAREVATVLRLYQQMPPR